MARPRVLVAHADRDCRHIYRSVLELEGMDVQAVETVDEALNSLLGSPTPYDAVVSDLYLRSTGDECLLRSVRRSTELARLPVLVVTGWTTDVHRSLATREGADDFLTLPVSAREVARRVRAICERARIRLPAFNGSDDASSPSPAP